MFRFVYQPILFAVIALAYSVLACAPGRQPALKEGLTRPAPNAQELSEWLQGPRRSMDSDLDSARYFIQMSDPQLGMSEYPLLFLLFRASYRDDHFEKDASLFESAIQHANEIAPDFVIVCGDLVHRTGHAGQIAEFKRIAATLNPSIPFYVVAGNHDVGNAPTAKSLMAYRKTFGPDRYSFRKGGIYGIVLNSQIINAPENVPKEAARQLSWVRDELARADALGAEDIIVFQHQPFFVERPDEDDNGSNIRQEARAVYLKLFKEAGVKAIMAGHLHRNAIGRDASLDLITTGPVGRPFGDDPSGFRIIELFNGNLRHEYFSLSPRNDSN